MWQYNSSDELYHYGVLGMRWGRRKGNSTSGSKRSKTRKSGRQMSQDAKEAKVIKKKKVSEMSNAELRKLNERQNLERNHKQLNPSIVSKGAKAVTATAVALGTIVGIQKNGGKVISMGKSAVDKISKGFVQNPVGNKVASKTLTILTNIKK